LIELESCVLCGESRSEKVVDTSDFILASGRGSTSFFRCMRCGLVYQNPRPDRSELAGLYPSEYRDFFGGGTGRGTSRREVGYLKRYVQSGNLLDIGSGRGEFLGAVKASGEWDLLGIEPDPAAAAVARDHYKLEIIQSSLEDALFEEGSFDAVTMWDSLEHLSDPLAALRQVYRLLKSGGWLLVRVPNVAGWEAAVFGRCWAGWDAPRHLSAFSPTSLQFALKTAGFQVERLFGGAEDYSSFAISLEFWLRSRSGQVKDKARSGNFLRKPYARALAYPFSWLSGKSKYRSRITAAAQKRSERDPHEEG
jgi:SAM-dependent methyltransferase